MEIERHRYGSSSSSSSSAAASPKQRPRHSIGFSCCFSTSGGGEAPAPSPTQSQSQSLLRSSSTWLRARAQDLPDIVGRLGRRRRFASGDFRYDPLSYALNFDEGGSRRRRRRGRRSQRWTRDRAPPLLLPSPRAGAAFGDRSRGRVIIFVLYR
ncbi:hypothetical protein ACMD2_12280 [Ananas comosus]|uniref:Uncharacterized protein n=1 Tax=Ananas comosus TaxID=4615 RepID=A0A199W7W7_ANACO|nr:hypothetical protein ACMD2_12280 [Ananas comosus]